MGEAAENLSTTLPPDIEADGGRFLNSKQTAAYLSISIATLWNHLREGKIPTPRYLGKKPYWRLADLRAFYENLPHSPYASSNSKK